MEIIDDDNDQVSIVMVGKNITNYAIQDVNKASTNELCAMAIAAFSKAINYLLEANYESAHLLAFVGCLNAGEILNREKTQEGEVDAG